MEPVQEQPLDLDKYYCSVWQCRQRTTNHCPQCQHTHYCSKAHQKQDWAWHKPLCQDETVLDGRRVTHVLYKVTEDVSRALDRYRYANCVVEGDTVVVSVSAETRSEEEERTRLQEFTAWMARETEEEQRLAQRSYWALRCMADAYALNVALYKLLRVFAHRGYKQVKWSATVVHRLEPALRVVAVQPKIRVERQVDQQRHTDKKRQPIVHCLVALAGDFVVDASAGRFWQFSEQCRPQVFCRDLEYEALVGQVSECSDAKAKAAVLDQIDEQVGERVDALVFRALCELGVNPDVLGELPEEEGARAQDVTAREERDAQRRRTLKQMCDDYAARHPAQSGHGTDTDDTRAEQQ